MSEMVPLMIALSAIAWCVRSGLRQARASDSIVWFARALVVSAMAVRGVQVQFSDPPDALGRLALGLAILAALGAPIRFLALRDEALRDIDFALATDAPFQPWRWPAGLVAGVWAVGGVICWVAAVRAFEAFFNAAVQPLLTSTNPTTDAAVNDVGAATTIWMGTFLVVVLGGLLAVLAASVVAGVRQSRLIGRETQAFEEAASAYDWTPPTGAVSGGLLLR